MQRSDITCLLSLLQCNRVTVSYWDSIFLDALSHPHRIAILTRMAYDAGSIASEIARRKRFLHDPWSARHRFRKRDTN